MARTLEERLQRLEGAHQIRNIFSAHAYTNVTGDEFQRHFSHTQPDVRFEIERMGITDGQENLSKRGQLIPAAPSVPTDDGLPRNAGRMSTHYQCSYVIVIAEDGKTAQATCLSPGHVTGAGTTFGKFAPMWSYCRYGMDYVREADGKWKIWHEHIFTVFNSVYYTGSWVQRSINNALQSATPPDMIPRNANRNTSIDAPFAMNQSPRLVPAPPIPYETFSETQAYIPPPAPDNI